MPIHILPTGDVSLGERFSSFANEFAYAMGSEIDFETVQLLKPDELVLSLVCIDPNRGVIPNGTTHKRSAGEFWTTYNVDYTAFTSPAPQARIEAIRDGIVAAVSQVPSSRMQDDVKAALIRAAEITVEKLMCAPDRLPQ